MNPEEVRKWAEDLIRESERLMKTGGLPIPINPEALRAMSRLADAKEALRIGNLAEAEKNAAEALEFLSAEHARFGPMNRRAMKELTGEIPPDLPAAPKPTIVMSAEELAAGNTLGKIITQGEAKAGRVRQEAKVTRAMQGIAGHIDAATKLRANPTAENARKLDEAAKESLAANAALEVIPEDRLVFKRRLDGIYDVLVKEAGGPRKIGESLRRPPAPAMMDRRQALGLLQRIAQHPTIVAASGIVTVAGMMGWALWWLKEANEKFGFLRKMAEKRGDTAALERIKEHQADILDDQTGLWYMWVPGFNLLWAARHDAAYTALDLELSGKWAKEDAAAAAVGLPPGEAPAAGEVKPPAAVFEGLPGTGYIRVRLSPARKVGPAHFARWRAATDKYPKAKDELGWYNDLTVFEADFLRRTLEGEGWVFNVDTAAEGQIAREEKPPQAEPRKPREPRESREPFERKPSKPMLPRDVYLVLPPEHKTAWSQMSDEERRAIVDATPQEQYRLFTEFIVRRRAETPEPERPTAPPAPAEPLDPLVARTTLRDDELDKLDRKEKAAYFDLTSEERGNAVPDWRYAQPWERREFFARWRELHPRTEAPPPTFEGFEPGPKAPGATVRPHPSGK